MKCTNCGEELVAGTKFCPNCGTKVALKKFCINCGIELLTAAKFCPECGAKQDETAPSAGVSASSDITVEQGTKYPTLESALKDIPAGGTIYIKAGNYEESVVIDKDVNLVGEGEVNFKNIPAEGYVFSTKDVTVNVTGINFDFQDHEDKEGVLSADSTISIQGNSTLTFRKCKFTNSSTYSEYALQLFAPDSGGKFSLIDCELEGFHIDSDEPNYENPEIPKQTLYFENVYIHDYPQPDEDSNDDDEDDDDDEPWNCDFTIKNSKFENMNIYVIQHTGGKGTIENTVFENCKTAIYDYCDCDGLNVKNVTIKNASEFGLLLAGPGNYSDIKISNCLYGIKACKDCTAEITAAEISDCKINGIWCAKDSKPILKDCFVASCKESGLYFDEGSAPVVDGCKSVDSDYYDDIKASSAVIKNSKLDLKESK